MSKNHKKVVRYVFVAGGVMSGVGKGIASASIAKILQSRGLEVTAMKIDPYVNVDAGTMNPTEHGEVFVLDDGTECDQDMGNYERFLDRNLSVDNYMTTGSVYRTVIQKERNLEYDGRCVHVVPDVPLEVIRRIEYAGKKTNSDIVVVEVGGTVGDYQNVLFLEAVRMMKYKTPKNVMLVLVSFVPHLGKGGNELKTKPTQHAVRNLNAVGLHPDFVLARASVPLDSKRKEKLEFMLGLESGSVVSAPDVDNIYDIPLNFEAEKLGDKILQKISLKPGKMDMKEWRMLAARVASVKSEVKVGIVGKYFGTGDFVLTDSYISVLEAIKHAAYSVNKKPVIEWVDAEQFESDEKKLKVLHEYDGIIIPGGFGKRGVEGKILAVKYCREKKIPYFGLCYGMQLAVVEFARTVLRLKSAHTTEVNPGTDAPVIDVLPGQKELLEKGRYGATMRLGVYPAAIKKNTLVSSLYDESVVQERHRHRYEVNPEFVKQLKNGGLVFSGMSPDEKLMEILELPANKHPFFVGTQFHPELKSRPLRPHPLFVGFLKACAARRQK